MRFLIINTDYRAFLEWLYREHRQLRRAPHAEQIHVRMESLCGLADFYSRNLIKLGHEACDVFANNLFAQEAWAREHGILRSPDWSLKFRLRRGFFPWVSFVREARWTYEILTAQVRHYKPDVVLNQNIHLNGEFFHSIKPYTRLVVGQHASPLHPGDDLSAYDLVFSSLPNLVDHFRKQGLRSEFIRLGFEPSVLTRVEERGQSIPVSFVGALSPGHSGRRRWLEYLCGKLGVQVWGDGIDRRSGTSRLRRAYRGQAWGIEMYRILNKSRVTLNHHIDVAESYANNMRLFEATGVRALLITDWKVNLQELFELGKEVVAYKSNEECAELARYYLEHDAEREAIARSGQQRTLREHTYYQRMEELLEIVRKYL